VLRWLTLAIALVGFNAPLCGMVCAEPAAAHSADALAASADHTKNAAIVANVDSGDHGDSPSGCHSSAPPARPVAADGHGGCACESACPAAAAAVPANAQDPENSKPHLIAVIPRADLDRAHAAPLASRRRVPPPPRSADLLLEKCSRQI